MTEFKAHKITQNVYWVGAIDWAIRNFHGYATFRGTTYNAYLVLGEKITLIDTVKAAFNDEMLKRIESVCDPKKIDYIISNHSEMDHSGCLPQMIEYISPKKVFASAMGVKALNEHFHFKYNLAEVKSGETIKLGDSTFTFIETKMLHWPDSMVSYLHEDKIMFSQDAFGMHLATAERFSDEIDKAILYEEGSKYFANILLPFSSLVEKLLADLPKLGIDIKIVAPDHGPVWRESEDIGWILSNYAKWAGQEKSKKAIIVYDTMWGSTDLMARAIGDGLSENGILVKLMPLSSSHRSDVATEILDAKIILVGSPTINNNIFPTLADVLYYLKGLKPKNLIGQVFGSYGWSGEAVKQLSEFLGNMGVKLIGEPQKVKYVPTSEDLIKCNNLGRDIAAILSEK